MDEVRTRKTSMPNEFFSYFQIVDESGLRGGCFIKVRTRQHCTRRGSVYVYEFYIHICEI